MKNLFAKLSLCAILALSGCNDGLKEATTEEADQGMADTMGTDMPAEMGDDSAATTP